MLVVNIIKVQPCLVDYFYFLWVFTPLFNESITHSMKPYETYICYGRRLESLNEAYKKPNLWFE
jgi:hypothetical protein